MPPRRCTLSGDVLSHTDLERRFTKLLAAHGPALSRLAGSYTRDRAEREDLLQEIGIAIWRALPGFRGECSERTFIFRIAHNRGMSHLARRRLPTVDLDTELVAADDAGNPEHALSVEQEGRRLFEAVQALPVGYRQVVMLALEGMAYAEMAEVLGISESNVGARLTRARQMLRARLSGNAAG